ncbi:thymus, brain and testes associated [Phyllostomus discolor]|uniref:Protein TBATA isoform X1 n=1 Tax=Phyllostomus discolor TaxID=89673 RepID=A0A7E6DV31_9CHIR|nr:protein TBATA isoform X1 [Phyllostomus discolor]KAF6111779.1 thymus, brain and testes associated [Phyllostomus discolor]
MATEVTTQLAEHPLSPRAELKAEKPEHSLRSHETDKPQKEPLVPGIVDFKVIQEALRTPKPQALGTYRFGHLSHHSFFSRHHPHPQRVTHIQDLTGRPVCVVRDKSSWSPLSQASLLSHYLMKMPTVPAPVGDPRSNRDPRLFSEAWKKELKDLASQVVTFSKENELKNKEQEEPKREQGAKYSAETGRLIPASTRALSRRHSRQSPGSYTPSRDGGVQTFVLQDQELLILELLCQILQTDSLSAIQFWLLFAPPKEKDLALGLLQTAVAQLLPQPLVSIPTEKLLNQLQEVQEPPQERPQPSFSQSPKKSKTTALPKSEKPEHIGKAQVLRIHSSQNTEEKAPKPKPEFQGVCPALPTQL